MTLLWWFLPHMESAMGVHVSPIQNPPPHPIPLGGPSSPALRALFHASNLGWWSVSHVAVYMFQSYSLKSSRPHLLPESKGLFFTSVSLLLSCI